MRPTRSSKLTNYLAGAGALGVATHPGTSEAATIYTDFQPDLLAQGEVHSYSDRDGIRIAIDVVNGLTATETNRQEFPPVGHSIFLFPEGIRTNGKGSAPEQLLGVNTLLGTGALSFGSIINENTSFLTEMSQLNTTSRTPLNGRHYQAFRYDNGDDVHYGWFHYEYQDAADPLDTRIVLLEAAIQSTPGRAIAIPEPSSLGLLALGAVAMAGRRRRPGKE